MFAFVPYLHRTHPLKSPSLSSSLIPDDGLQQRYNNEDGLGDVQIPSTGVSINDEMESNDKDRFETEVVPIRGFNKVAAQVVTTSTSTGSFEPVRYLISLSQPTPKGDQSGEKDAGKEDSDSSDGIKTIALPSTEPRTFVLVDIPPFSPKLAANIKAFMGENSELKAILVTSRDGIHYDDAPAVYRLRRTDLDLWRQAFPALAIVAYRLDIPRDCRDSITQVLDGYGPFAFNGDVFEETGRPLSHQEWDHDVAQDILRGRTAIKDEAVPEDTAGEYTEEGIRAKEKDKEILAVYTPGHSFGAVSYVFPKTGLCCSGFTIPVEDTRDEENPGLGNAGPALDCRGYITTSRGGVAKQMESARQLVRNYCDRFRAVLPSRGDPLILEDNLEVKRKVLFDIFDQYLKIGRIYEQLGITGDEDD